MGKTPRTADQAQFAGRLALITGQRGSVARLAREMGVSERLIRRWRSGEVDPSRSNLIALARAAGVTVQWLAAGVEPMRAGMPARADAELFAKVAAALEAALRIYGPRASAESKRLRTEYEAQDSLEDLVERLERKHIDLLARMEYASERAALAAEVYNRVLQVPSGAARERALYEEAKQFARLATLLQKREQAGGAESS